jgi:hypothetical protein
MPRFALAAGPWRQAPPRNHRTDSVALERSNSRRPLGEGGGQVIRHLFFGIPLRVVAAAHEHRQLRTHLSGFLDRQPIAHRVQNGTQSGVGPIPAFLRPAVPLLDMSCNTLLVLSSVVLNELNPARPMRSLLANRSGRHRSVIEMVHAHGCLGIGHHGPNRFGRHCHTGTIGQVTVDSAAHRRAPAWQHRCSIWRTAQHA